LDKAISFLDKVRRLQRSKQSSPGEERLADPLPCVSHRAFAGMAAGDVLKNPLEGARCQNIQNNPMQSSGRPAWMRRKQVDTSGKSGAFLHHPAIL
jgi:hypothetical protein